MSSLKQALTPMYLYKRRSSGVDMYSKSKSMLKRDSCINVSSRYHCFIFVVSLDEYI